MNIEKAKIYGVDKVGSSTPSALTRTDDAVGLSYTVGTTDIVSDFDRCYPWSDIVSIPSCIRYWWREYKIRKGLGNTLPPYDRIWFEGWATRLGEKHFN